MSLKEPAKSPLVIVGHNLVVMQGRESKLVKRFKVVVETIIQSLVDLGMPVSLLAIEPHLLRPVSENSKDFTSTEAENLRINLIVQLPTEEDDISNEKKVVYIPPEETPLWADYQEYWRELIKTACQDPMLLRVFIQRSLFASHNDEEWTNNLAKLCTDLYMSKTEAKMAKINALFDDGSSVTLTDRWLIQNPFSEAHQDALERLIDSINYYILPGSSCYLQFLGKNEGE